MDLAPVAMMQSAGKVLAIDLGENNLAATSEGKILKGINLRHERDKYLGLQKSASFQRFSKCETALKRNLWERSPSCKA